MYSCTNTGYQVILITDQGMLARQCSMCLQWCMSLLKCLTASIQYCTSMCARQMLSRLSTRLVREESV